MNCNVCREVRKVAAAALAATFSILRPVQAIQYCRAALRDERSGFSMTAAVQWRKAARLAGPIGPLAEHCWREWERIMNVPRSFAEAVEVMPRDCTPPQISPLWASVQPQRPNGELYITAA